MSNGGSNQPRQTRNEARAAAREKARQLREEQKKRERRNKILLQGGIIVAVVAVLALVGGLIFNSVKPAGPGPRNMASDGVLIQGSGGKVSFVETPALASGATPTANTQDKSGNVANIVTYIDYLCPFCGQFERTNATTIQKLVEQGAATLEVHPIALLAPKASNYSTRSANAAACIIDSGQADAFLKFQSLLYGNQPDETSANGLSNDDLKRYAKQAGATGVDSCIDGGNFKGWVSAATERAITQPVPNSNLPRIQGTPTVLVNGQPYAGSITHADEFQSFVTKAASQSYTKSTATPTPTPSPAQ